MDQYLILETLPTGASQRTKSLQLSKVRSHAARKRVSKLTAPNIAQTIPVSRKQPRSTWIAAHQPGPLLRHLRPHVTKQSGDACGLEYVDTGSSRDASEYWQLVKRLTVGPKSLLSASKSDPFRTYPVSEPRIRFSQLLDFGK
jgi:hypothetical protein